MTDLNAPLPAFVHETDALTETLHHVVDHDWRVDTPAAGWTVTHQVAHVISVYRLAVESMLEPDRFAAMLGAMAGTFESNVTALMAPMLELDNRALLDLWTRTVTDTVAASDAVPASRIVPWLVNPIPAGVLIMAGMSEAFAHGQDVYDTFGIEHPRHDGVRVLCEFVYHTRTFGYLARGQQPPTTPLRFELISPTGQTWTIGDPEAEDLVCGEAWDLALLASRRRHAEDLTLFPTGAFAAEWMGYAQSYRGPAGSGRKPLARSGRR